MMRLINANEIPWCNYDLDNYHSFVGVDKEYVDEMPTIEAEPVRHGRWIDFDYDIGGYRNIGEKCSLCGFETHQTNGSEYSYCPNCGAKMDLEE